VDQILPRIWPRIQIQEQILQRIWPRIQILEQILQRIWPRIENYSLLSDNAPTHLVALLKDFSVERAKSCIQH